jgi:hypothetical protein
LIPKMRPPRNSALAAGVDVDAGVLHALPDVAGELPGVVEIVAGDVDVLEAAVAGENEGGHMRVSLEWGLTIGEWCGRGRGRSPIGRGGGPH